MRCEPGTCQTCPIGTVCPNAPKAQMELDLELRYTLCPFCHGKMGNRKYCSHCDTWFNHTEKLLAKSHAGKAKNRKGRIDPIKKASRTNKRLLF